MNVTLKKGAWFLKLGLFTLGRHHVSSWNHFFNVLSWYINNYDLKQCWLIVYDSLVKGLKWKGWYQLYNKKMYEKIWARLDRRAGAPWSLNLIESLEDGPDDMIWINRLAWTSRFGSISITPRSEDHARINLYLTVSRRCQNTRYIYIRDKDLDKNSLGEASKPRFSVLGSDTTQT